MKLHYHILVWILIILLFSWIAAKATTTTITSLPYTANQTGTAYSETLVVQGHNPSYGVSISSATNGILFHGHDIILNLGQDSIIFGMSDNDNAYALRFGTNNSPPCDFYGDADNYNPYNIKILGGYLIHSPSTDIAADGAICANFFRGTHDVLFDGTSMTVSGDNALCVGVNCGEGATSYNIEISGDAQPAHYRSDSRRYTSRCSYDGAVIRLQLPSASGSYDAIIHGINIETGPGQGIVLYGSGAGGIRGGVWACTVSVDQRNDFYTPPSGNVCWGSGNAYDIIGRFVAADFTIHDNICRAGETYGGAEGILIENSFATRANPCVVYNNDVRIHEGYDAAGYCRPYAGKIRNIDSGPLRGLWIHHNYFEASADTSAATTAWSNAATGLVLGYDETFQPSGDIIIENNHVRVYNHLGTGATQIMALMLDVYPGTLDSSNFIVRNNYFESSQFIFSSGGANGGSDLFNDSGDTLAFADITTDDACTYHISGPITNCGGGGTNNAPTTDDAVTDAVYLNGASDTNIVFYGLTSDQELFLRKTLTVTIIGNNSLPVYAASCTLWNAYNHIVLTGTTDSLGEVSGPAVYWYESRTATDSIAYNPFTVHAQKSTTKTAGDYTVTWDNGDTTLTLNVAGSGWPDTLNFCFMHQSVGNVIIGSADILDSVAQIYEVVANHYSVVRFWHYLTNSYGRGLYEPDANTLISSDEYGWIQSDPGPFFVIGYSIASSPQLYYVWQDASNTDAWDLVSEIRVPYPAVDDSSDVQLYVIQKPPYHQWYAPDGPPTERTPTPERMAALKSYYEAIRDTVTNHPEVRFVVAGGTPLVLETTGPADFHSDTSLAKIVYQFQWWFADTFDVAACTNFWKQDNGYLPFCETSADSANRYCLKSALSSGDSHPNITGGAMMQDSLVSFMARLAQDILQKTYGEEEPPPPSVDSLATCWVDSSAHDYSGENDHDYAIYMTQSAMSGESVFVFVSLSGQPDTSASNRYSKPFVAGITDSMLTTYQLNESGTVYYAFTVCDDAVPRNWSVFKYRTKYFYSGLPEVEPLASVAIDSSLHDFSGELDYDYFVFTAQNTTGDTVFVAISTMGYPDTSASNRIGIPFVAATTDSALFTTNLSEPGTIYGRGWVTINATPRRWSIPLSTTKTFGGVIGPGTLIRNWRY